MRQAGRQAGRHCQSERLMGPVLCSLYVEVYWASSLSAAARFHRSMIRLSIPSWTGTNGVVATWLR